VKERKRGIESEDSSSINKIVSLEEDTDPFILSPDIRLAVVDGAKNFLSHSGIARCAEISRDGRFVGRGAVLEASIAKDLEVVSKTANRVETRCHLHDRNP
jgi:hypothetical protein